VNQSLYYTIFQHI